MCPLASDTAFFLNTLRLSPPEEESATLFYALITESRKILPESFQNFLVLK
jgi:hypothetical protein